MLAVMQETGANYAVFGQVAGIMHGSLDQTGDLDLLWDGDPAFATRMAEVFVRAGVVLRNEHLELQAVADYYDGLCQAKVYFEGLGSAGDLCTPRLRWGSLDVVAFLKRKVWACHGTLVVPYVCLDDLITMRKAVTGPKHAAEDAARGPRTQGHDH